MICRNLFKVLEKGKVSKAIVHDLGFLGFRRDLEMSPIIVQGLRDM